MNALTEQPLIKLDELERVIVAYDRQIECRCQSRKIAIILCFLEDTRYSVKAKTSKPLRNNGYLTEQRALLHGVSSTNSDWLTLYNIEL